ncbi:hypothetical protein HMPREF1624_07799 [Sporothrix schenckii ATCC 58251]|uniref:Uncharacterized protein n=2 Tax=Sporothrix schenckii TaxID=29908 RepID=U7PLU6_SPOS1|nr:hypothetical protein HMPREF1624_07799 [Sporothrix schenckii ATCC 58251]
MSPLERFSKWVQLKIYQFEVTYSVYMLTPTEKFFVYSLLFLLTSLTSIAIFLYLPHHVAFLINRAWFYAHGDSQFDAAQSLLQGVVVAEKAGTTAAVQVTTTVESLADAAATVVREL